MIPPAGNGRANNRAPESRHRRYFQVAGVTVQVDSDLPFAADTFAPELDAFAVHGPGTDVIRIHHHFELPDLHGAPLGQQVYRKPPWEVYRRDDGWVYLGIAMRPDDPPLFAVAEFDRGHTQGRIHSPDASRFRQGNLKTLTMFRTDEILLARVFADRRACYLHSAAAVVDGAGLLLVGHSGAGKSTAVAMLEGHAEILCDDRNIVRRWPDGVRVHGSWSCGEEPRVSASSASLAAILFLVQSRENRLDRLDDGSRIVANLVAATIRPLADAGWWGQTLDLLVALAAEIPCYEMRFDKSGAIVPLLLDLARLRSAGADARIPARP